MNNKLQGKVALVTGAGRGIGRAIAHVLGAAGGTVILTARNESDLMQTADNVQDAGGCAELIPADLADESSIMHLVEAIKEKFQTLDILVNNAGMVFSGLLENASTDDWDRCLAVNARAPFILCREVIPLLRKAGQGYIINISSVVGVKGYPLQSIYTASKHALRGMSISLAEELRKDNIRVHVICPGGVDTELVSRVRPDIKKDELIQPEEIAELVLYLVTHKGNAVIDDLHIRRATSSPWF
ncbi:MAG: SDR family oxidoreductase [Sedimentisphaerales bacterium]|nr:SDR family oxidoreductase [Sedimentisphaerales bacterium]